MRNTYDVLRYRARGCDGFTQIRATMIFRSSGRSCVSQMRSPRIAGATTILFRNYNLPLDVLSFAPGERKAVFFGHSLFRGTTKLGPVFCEDREGK